jgi:predicted nucleotidyltransferase
MVMDVEDEQEALKQAGAVLHQLRDTQATKIGLLEDEEVIEKFLELDVTSYDLRKLFDYLDKDPTVLEKPNG